MKTLQFLMGADVKEILLDPLLDGLLELSGWFALAYVLVFTIRRLIKKTQPK